MLALCANGISKAYGSTTVLSSVSLSVEEGEIHALIGPKGCGNKTAAYIFCAMISATRGKCSLFETSVKDVKNVHTICGLANSDIELYPHLSGFDNLVLVASFFGIDKNTAGQRASSLMKELDIWQYHETAYKDYSDTAKKLLSLARAMIHKPKILFIEKNKEDDNLKYNEAVSRFIKHHQKEDKLTVCLITDDAKFAEENASSFTVLFGGRVLCSGNLNEIIERYPMETYAAIICDKKPEGFVKSGEYWKKEIKDEAEFSKILLDTVLMGAKIKKAEIISPDFAAIYNKIMKECSL